MRKSAGEKGEGEPPKAAVGSVQACTLLRVHSASAGVPVGSEGSLQVWEGPACAAGLGLWGGFIANDSFSLFVEFPSLDESLGDMCPPGISVVMESATVTAGTNSSS